MYNEVVNEYNKNFNTIIKLKNILCANNFFSNEKMQRLLSIIKEENNMNTYLSTEFTENNTIRISLRQNYFKKFNYSIEPLDYYTIINNSVSRLIDEYLPEVMNILHEESIDSINIIRNNVNMLYTLTRPSPGIIIIEF